MISFIGNSHYTEARQQRMMRLQTEANRLFSIRTVRESCHTAIASCSQQPLADVALQGGSSEYWVYHFAQNLISTFEPVKREIIRWTRGCQPQYLFQEAHELREEYIEKFAQIKIASRWYQMIDDDQTWRIFAQNIPFGESGREDEINLFFKTLNNICILTDILMGYAGEYGIDVDYIKCIPNKKDEKKETFNGLSMQRQAVIDDLWELIDKGEWTNGALAESIKEMMTKVLEHSEAMWKLLGNGRSDRIRVTWQNLIGYFSDRGLLPNTNRMGSPALNRMFFANNRKYPGIGSDIDTSYSNIDKGRPSRNNMSNSFSDVLPVLDEYCP